MSDEGFRPHPEWRHAARQLIEHGYTYGKTVSDAWLNDAFGIKEASTIADHERNKLHRLKQLDLLREHLLRDKKMLLQRIHGVGFLIVAPEDHTSVAVRNRRSEIGRSIRKLSSELANVNLAMLTDDQRSHNANAQAKAAQLKSAFDGRSASPIRLQHQEKQ